ncbi:MULTISPECIES: lasso RiPP family leader peptide-containing protein [Streptomyces]|nr:MULTISPECIES: lasso RiPP family leader peptide-containing protein [Streptomyces]
MREAPEANETAEYEPPELAEAGAFAERTLGFTGELSDGWGGQHSTFW